MSDARTNDPARTPILSTPCSWPGCSLWFAKAFLFRDCVRLEGWSWTGRQARRIPLDEIERVRWWGVSDGVNFMLCLDGGERLPLRLERGAGTWNCKIHDLLDQSLLDGPGVPDAEPEGAADTAARDAAADGAPTGDALAGGTLGGDGAVGHDPPPRTVSSRGPSDTASPTPSAATGAPDACAPDASASDADAPDADAPNMDGPDGEDRESGSGSPPADAPA